MPVPDGVWGIILEELHLFIINPTAGKGKEQKKLPHRIESTARDLGIDYEIYITSKPGDGGEHVAAAAKDGRSVRAYACGGDGTLNELVNAAADYPNVAFGIYPCGSGNDLVKVMPHPDKHTSLLAQMKGQVRTYDMLQVNNRKCANILNTGFDATVVHKLHLFKRLPLITGHMAYILAVISALATSVRFTMSFTFDDGTVIEEECLLAAAGSGASYGGGFLALPLASPDDGLMDVCIVKKISRIHFAGLIGKYKKGQHLTDSAVTPYILYRQCKSVTIEHRKTSWSSVDGELFSEPKLNVCVIPKALRIITP